MNTKITSFKDDIIHLTYNRDTHRKNGLSYYKYVGLTGRNAVYPNVLLTLLHEKTLISPYDEKIMSLQKETFYDDNIFEYKNESILLNELTYIKDPVYFLIYNFDNYYHFLYDTIPYLYNYFNLKKTYPTLKLLVNYPNVNKSEFYKFNIDILEIFIDMNNDLLLHNETNIYERMFVSTSLTHGGMSNSPPNREIYSLYSTMKCNLSANSLHNPYKYIYISRRTWINKDTSNIGTNYTTRRKMMNEDLLVEELEKLGIKEIFSENLSMNEKIYLFNNAKLIVGSIGGGMSNLLFSQPTTKSIVIVTPEFLDINERFKYSMEHTDIFYFNEVETYKEDNSIPLFCRAKILITGKYKDKIGEIIDYNSLNNKYQLNISSNDVAGFNNDILFEKEWFYMEEFHLLDKGLNSPYVVDINKIISLTRKQIADIDQMYTIINKTTNIIHTLSIEDIIALIIENPMDIYYKLIDGVEILIHNEIITNAKFICHRINTTKELNKIPNIFGVELDIRDNILTNTLHLSHDPFENGEDFEEYLKQYNHGTLILNIKSERTEIKCIELMEKYNITNFFFLDSTIPMMYLLNNKYNNSNIACRFSEFEPIESYNKIKTFIKWIWVDCFTQFPLSSKIYNTYKNDNKNICIVSPELQNQPDRIKLYREHIIQNKIIPDAICCKIQNIIQWI